MPWTLPLDALVFDLGGVIVPHDNAQLYSRLAAGCAAADAARRIEAASRDPRYGTGALPVAALHERLQRELGYRPDWESFVADWCSHLSLDPAMLALVERLADSNRVLIFSNTNREHWEYLVALSGGALARFEAYLSHEIGRLKPATEAFLLVAERAGIAPERSLFIDDLPENVEGARRAGFAAEVFTGREALERLLAGRVSADRPPAAGRAGSPP